MTDRRIYTEAKRLLSDREWRLNHLYKIQDVHGREIAFKMNEAQRRLWKDLHYCNVVPKARQLGFSTFISMFELDTCLFRPNTAAGIIDITLDDAKRKLAKIKFAYDRLPAQIRKTVTLDVENTQELRFSNGSSIVVGTSHRGGTLQILHVSEFGKIAASHPEKAREIRTGAFGTVHKGQMIFVESTAEGAAGDFHDLVMQAQADQQEGRKLGQQDFKLHFFPWWMHKGYSDDPDSIVIPQELDEYFNGLAGEGIHLTPGQRAWYVSKRRTVGPDDMWREYPSKLEEAFNASIEGAYFKVQMTKMRETGRLAKIPINPTLPVNTFWDIGVDDSTAVWFHQAGATGSHALIDYYEASGEGIDHYIRILRERAAQHGYIYGKHFGPHDLDHRNWAVPGAKPIVETARELGISFQVVPRVANKIEAIEAARAFLSVSSIDIQRCDQGIKCLDSYRKAWDEKRGTWRSEPLHDWASHGADALMTGACGFRPDYVEPATDRYNRRRAPRRSAWAA